MPFETYRTHIPGWATSVEAVSDSPLTLQESIEIDLEQPPRFLIGVLSLPNGQQPPWLKASVSISARRLDDETYSEFGLEETNNEQVFVNEGRTLFIFNQPIPTNWRISISEASVPIALNLLAFHPNDKLTSGFRWRVRWFRGWHFRGPSHFKCRACKITAKALALAIVAAATLPTLPAALIASVSAYLGVAAIIAAQFIASVIGDAVDIITEKLCRMIGMCP